jgi:hypothetical protein
MRRIGAAYWVEVTELVQWKRGIKIRAIENGPCNIFNKLSSAFKDGRKPVSWWFLIIVVVYINATNVCRMEMHQMIIQGYVPSDLIWRQFLRQVAGLCVNICEFRYGGFQSCGCGCGCEPCEELSWFLFFPTRTSRSCFQFAWAQGCSAPTQWQEGRMILSMGLSSFVFCFRFSWVVSGVILLKRNMVSWFWSIMCIS